MPEPINEDTLDFEKVVERVRKNVGDQPPGAEERAREALKRLDSITERLAERGERFDYARFPHFLILRDTDRDRKLAHVGQRFKITAYEKKRYTGDFEITQIMTLQDSPRDRGRDYHMLIMRRVLETKVSQARKNRIQVPLAALESAIPWNDWNQVMFEVMEEARAQGRALYVATANDPQNSDSMDSTASLLRHPDSIEADEGFAKILEQSWESE